MNCLECRELLHLRLDGDGSPLSDVAKRTLRDASCRSLFAGAALLLRGLAARPALVVPSTLADRLATQVISDREKRRVRSRARWTAIIGLAASVLLLVGVAQLLTPPEKLEEPIPIPPIAQVPKQESPAPAPMALAPRAEEARQAVAGLTERLAGETREQARLLWSVAAPMNLASLDPIPNMDPLEPIEPAAESLLETGRQVRDGFEPVTRSARRAFSFFTREFAMLDRPTQ